MKCFPFTAVNKGIKNGGTYHGPIERLSHDRVSVAGQDPIVDCAIRVARGSDWHRSREAVLGMHVDCFGIRHRIRPDGYAGQQPAGVRVSHVRHHRTHDAGRHRA